MASSRSNSPELVQTAHWAVWLVRNSLGGCPAITLSKAHFPGRRDSGFWGDGALRGEFSF